MSRTATAREIFAGHVADMLMCWKRAYPFCAISHQFDGQVREFVFMRHVLDYQYGRTRYAVGVAHCWWESVWRPDLGVVLCQGGEPAVKEIAGFTRELIAVVEATMYEDPKIERTVHYWDVDADVPIEENIQIGVQCG